MGHPLGLDPMLAAVAVWVGGELFVKPANSQHSKALLGRRNLAGWRPVSDLPIDIFRSDQPALSPASG